MAATTRKRRSPFGDILRGELDEHGVSIRELARRLSSDEARVENVRRSLMRYIHGEVAPGLEMREAIADALGIDAEVFAEDAERAARRERLLSALEPLADVLLELAVETREAHR